MKTNNDDHPWFSNHENHLSNETHVNNEITKPTQSKILVVDDEDIIHRTLKRVLGNEEYIIDSAYSGKEGLKKIKAGFDYDLLICDICMPDMGGVEVLNEIRKAGIDIEVLMFTGYSTLDAIDKAKNYGAYDCLTKSFTDISVLKNKIKEALLKSKVKHSNKNENEAEKK